MSMVQILFGLLFIGIPFIKYSKSSDHSPVKKHEDAEVDSNREPYSTRYYQVSLCGGNNTISLYSAFIGFMNAPQVKFCYFTVRKYMPMGYVSRFTSFSWFQKLHVEWCC